jgi:hypothetical protein
MSFPGPDLFIPSGVPANSCFKLQGEENQIIKIFTVVTWPDGARPLLFVRTSIITANVANEKTTTYCSDENTKLKRLSV